MKVNQLSKTNSVLNSFLYEIRDISIQNDRMRFKRNIERIGEILAFEMSKSFHYEEKIATTPLGEKAISIGNNNIVVCSILRAGLPLQNGMLNYFDGAESAFISAYRKHEVSSSTYSIEIEYVACPNLTDKTLVLVDPMLATGQSLVLTYDAIKQFGNPREIHLVSIIGSKDGVDYVANNFPSDTSLWIADIDDHLNKRGYIVPGLGDAGDLSFGQKLQK